MGVDFDKLHIAKEYVQGRQLVPGAIKVWKEAILKYVDGGKVKAVLDLGCGIGQFLPFLQELFPDSKVTGIEPSTQMLSQAKEAHGQKFDLISARAEELPLADSSLDLVFMKMVYHTLSDKVKGLREILRVLRPGGNLVMKHFTSETNEDNVFWKFFPGSFQFAIEQSDSKDDIVNDLTSAGFVEITAENITYPIANNYWELFKRETQRGRSIYKFTPDEVWNRDVENFRKFCEAHGQEGPIEDKRYLFVFVKPE